MADLLFTIGADDRAFQQALGRIEANSGAAAKSLGKIFGIGSTYAVAQKALSAAIGLIDAYGNSSDEARHRVDSLNESVQRLKVSLGEDLVGGIEAGKPAMEWFAKFWQSIVNKEADVMRWAFGEGGGFMGESDRIDQMRAGEVEAKKRARQRRSYDDYRPGLEADAYGAIGDTATERRLREEMQNRRRRREIGAMDLPPELRSRLMDLEGARHGLAEQARKLQEAKDLRDKWVDDRRSERFNILENANVADATTRRQIIGSNGFSWDFTAVYKAAQQQLIDQGRKQLEALRAVENNTRKGGATFQP